MKILATLILIAIFVMSTISIYMRSPEAAFFWVMMIGFGTYVVRSSIDPYGGS